MNRIIDRLLAPPQAPLTPGAIIIWWERRRVGYNAYLAIIGIASLLLLLFFTSRSSLTDTGDDFIQPLAVLIAPVFANIAFTGGWIVQLIMRAVFRDTSPDTGPTLLKAGLIISTIVVLLPAATWGVTWMASLVR